MQQFKALLIKEWNTHRKSFLTPTWVLMTIYLLSLVTFVYGSIRYGLPSIVQTMDAPENQEIALWILHYAATIFIAGISILTTLVLTEATLNHDYIKRCEIFHLSQPVSLKKILAAKAIFVSVGIFLQYLVLMLVNYLVMSVGMAILGFNSYSLGFNAVLYTIPYIITSMLMLIPTLWFFTCVFRKNSFIKMILFFVIFDVVGLILKISWGVKLYSLTGFWSRVVMTPFNLITRRFAAIEVGVGNMNWDFYWTQENWIWLGLNVVLVIASYFIYKRRNIS